MCFLGDLSYRAAEINVDHAYLVLVNEPVGDLGHGFWLIVPDLYSQWPWFLCDSPAPVGMLGLMFIEPDKSTRIDHFGSKQAGATKLADDLPKSIIREAGHRRLKKGGVDQQWANPQGRNVWQVVARG